VSRRTAERWLRCYPRAWRERYGEELVELASAMSGDGHLAWRARLDLLRAGARERLREWGLGGGDISPRDRVRAGVLLVLCSWGLFLIGGAMLQRFSENWRHVTPGSARGLPAGAYDSLVAIAAIAGTLVLIGIAWALPRTGRFLVDGGWPRLRAPVIRATLAAVVAVGGLLVLVVWSHHLDLAQRNGRDLGYELAFVAWGLLVVGALASWTAVAIGVARRIELSTRLLRTETLLAVSVTLCMALALVATAVWWGALAHAAPWALHADPAGTAASPVSVQLLLAGVLMIVATALAATGAGCALRAATQLSREH
jgi:hypothetical protein